MRREVVKKLSKKCAKVINHNRNFEIRFLSAREINELFEDTRVEAGAMCWKRSDCRDFIAYKKTLLKNDGTMIRLIAHEVSHLNTPGQHGKQWKAKYKHLLAFLMEHLEKRISVK